MKFEVQLTWLTVRRRCCHVILDARLVYISLQTAAAALERQMAAVHQTYLQVGYHLSCSAV